MMFFAVVDAEGRVLRTGGCAASALGVQAEREGEWVVEHPGGVLAATHRYQDGAFVPLPERPGPWAVFDYATGVWTDPRDAEDHAQALKQVRADAIAEVNRVSGDLRSAFITVIPGQEMLYLLKEREAIRWLQEASDHDQEPETNPAPDLSQFELIAAEVGITAPDATSVAQVYVNMAAMLRQTAARLETLRLGTIAVMEGASDTAAIEAALAQFLTVAAQ